MAGNFRTGFDSNDVMAYILAVCEKSHIDWNMTKAQRLLYCCYGTVLAAFNERLTEEAPQAWKFGPVFPRTFNEIKKGGIIPGVDHGFSAECDPEWLPLIELTVNTFGKFSSSQLSTWSHRRGSPWDKATNEGELLGVQLLRDDIRPYFQRMFKKSAENNSLI